MARVDNLIDRIEDNGLREDLKREVNRITSEKSFGLVWEEKFEQVIEDCKEKIPVLKEREDLAIHLNDELNTGIIIEGDNYHALSTLNYTHAGKIDVIYIDPPYNNGKKTWKYNNNYIDKKDAYKHSKWLSMMHKRMELAKNLLKEDGVFICAIDENELETLLLLIDHVFGDEYAKDTITVVHNPRGIQGDNFSYVNEYAIFVYRKGKKVVATRDVSPEDIDWEPLRNWGDESERYDAANCFYAIYVKDGEIIGFGDNITHEDIHPKQTEYDEKNDTYAIYPIDTKGVERKWRYERGTVEGIIDLLRVKKTKKGYDIEIGKDFAPYRTVWTNKKYDANEYGTQLINSMVPNNEFDYPKSLYTEYDCLEAVTKGKPDALILDYFAGSGTTGHATLMLNKKLGGNRNFILCSNNEVGEKREKQYRKKHGKIDCSTNQWKEWEEKYGIARSITYTRIASAINGFVHKKKFKTTLFEKKLTYARIKKADKIVQEIEKLKEQYAEAYTDFDVLIEDNFISLIGLVDGGEQIEGIPSNLRYFVTDYVEKEDTLDKLRRELSPACEDMIRIREGSFIKILDEPLLKIYKNSRGLTAIIYDSFEIEQYIEKIEQFETNAPIHLYVFSYSKANRMDEMPKNLKYTYEAQPIPEGVLEIYKRIFEKGGLL